MGRDALGEFEHQVMLAVARLEDEAYSVPIVLELEQCTDKAVSPAAVHIALQRLEKRGLLESHLEPASDRSPRPRRYVHLTEAGLERLRDSRRAFERLWKGLGPVFGR